MESFYQHYDLSLREKLKVKNYESENNVKLYVAHNLNDLVTSVNNVKHSNTGLTECFLYSPIKLYLDELGSVTDKRMIKDRFIGIDFDFYEYSYPYISIKANSLYSDLKTYDIGVDLEALLDLNNNHIPTPIILNSRFSHFENQQLPELRNFDLNQNNFKRKVLKGKKRASKKSFGLVYS